MRVILRTLGYFITVFSICFFVVYVGMLISGEEDSGVLLGLMALLAGTGIFGAYLVRAGNRRGAELQEKKILQLAASKGGRITPEEVAKDTHLTVDESKAILDTLCEQGSGQLQVTDQGNLVYVFSGLLSEEERASARSPLDS